MTEFNYHPVEFTTPVSPYWEVLLYSIMEGSLGLLIALFFTGIWLFAFFLKYERSLKISFLLISILLLMRISYSLFLNFQWDTDLDNIFPLIIYFSWLLILSFFSFSSPKKIDI